MIIRKEIRKQTRSIFSTALLLVGVVLTFSACTPDRTDDPIPYQPFPDIIINLNQPEFVGLKIDGRSKTISNGGIRGIIIYRQSATSYLAFEKNCSYQPNSACATVDVDITTLFMRDPCCGSSFRFPDGEPTGGLAWRPLRKYATYLDGNELTITDEILQ